MKNHCFPSAVGNKFLLKGAGEHSRVTAWLGAAVEGCEDVGEEIMGA